MEPFQPPKCVMIISGEASGDLHASRLVRAMRKRVPALFFCGVGGKFLRDAGVRILVEASSLSVVGFTEAFSKIPVLVRGMVVVKKFLKSLRPDLLILIDFPDFNLHAASVAKKLGIPVLYYISPQVWAWRSGRINKIKHLYRDSRKYVQKLRSFQKGPKSGSKKAREQEAKLAEKLDAMVAVLREMNLNKKTLHHQD